MTLANHPDFKGKICSQVCVTQYVFENSRNMKQFLLEWSNNAYYHIKLQNSAFSFIYKKEK